VVVLIYRGFPLLGGCGGRVFFGVMQASSSDVWGKGVCGAPGRVAKRSRALAYLVEWRVALEDGGVGNLGRQWKWSIRLP